MAAEEKSTSASASADTHKHLRPQWAGRDVCDLDHGADLDREAALHEFEGKLPRHQAEDKAYSDYKHKQHARAAAHHLQGIKLAEAAGDEREGRKHGLMYQLHLQHLGHEPIGPVPKEVQQHLDAGSGSDGGKFYSYKPHRGDIFVLDGLGKKEKNMAMDNDEILNDLDLGDDGLGDVLLDWERHDDNTGGFLQAMDKTERLVYRTWAIERGARPTQHVLVKHDGVRQTTLGYFDTREDALAVAEGFTTMAKADQLEKEGQLLSMTPMGVPQTAKSEGKKPKLGSGGRFEQLKNKLSHKSGVHDPAAVAAAIGRKKYGAKRMGEMSHHKAEESSGSRSSASGSASGGENSGLARLHTAMGKADNAGLAAVRAAQEKGGKEASEGMGASASASSVSKGSASWEGSSSSASSPSASSVSKGSAPWEGSSSSASSMSKGSHSTSMSNSEGSASISHSDGETRLRARMDKAEGQTSGEHSFFAMAESNKCAKCGMSDCKCGNLGKAELCRMCKKATNLCKCPPMHKAEAERLNAEDEQKAHEARLEEGRQKLSKSLAKGIPEVHTFGKNEKGEAVGTAPENLGERLHNLYVAAKFALEKAGK